MRQSDSPADFIQQIEDIRSTICEKILESESLNKKISNLSSLESKLESEEEKLNQQVYDLVERIANAPVMKNKYLQRVSPPEGLVLPSADSRILDAKDIFKAGIEDGLIDKWKSSKESRERVIVDVYEQHTSTEIMYLFKSLALGCVDEMILTYQEVVMFCKTHPDWLVWEKGQQNFTRTFFVSEFLTTGKAFIPYVDVSDIGFELLYRPYDSAGMWYGNRGRIVVKRSK
jgi:hypothetical protein